MRPSRRQKGVWLLVLVVSGFAVAAWSRERSERTVVALIEANGGTVQRVGWFDPRIWHWQGVEKVKLRGTGTDSGMLGSLQHLPALRSLDLADTPFRDQDLSHLLRCAGLTKIRLDRTAITDAGLKQIAAMTQLESLWLVDTSVTDACLLYTSPSPRDS